MKKLFVGCLLPTVYCLLPAFSFSQSCTSLNIMHQSDIASTCNFSVMTMMHDELARPYLYVANKEGGLKIYDISTVATPSLVATVPVNLYDTLHVMNLDQDGNYLYLAIGSHFNTSKCGMAIVDVTNPISPTVTDHWVMPNSIHGAGIVKVEGNYAYLGAMVHGLVILDISNKANIQFVSQFVPGKYFPPIANPDTTKINARGMEVKNSIVYLCHDAGGLRIINCTNKTVPVETGRWCNPATYIPFNRPRAYNNIVIDDTLAYLAVDYCGLEVVNISDTSNIQMIGWWNPYNCPNSNWFTSPSHANELAYNKSCKQLYVSTGKSDMMVLDVSDPTQPDSCNFYGGVSNSIGTWGVNMYQDQLYLSYICTLGIPFASNWTGVKLLTYTPCVVGIEEKEEHKYTVYPMPVHQQLNITLPEDWTTGMEITVWNQLGQQQEVAPTFKRNNIEVASRHLSPGIYFFNVQQGAKAISGKFMKE